MAKAFFRITLDNGITPLVLAQSPAGIHDFEITYKRHEVYGSVFRNIGGSLRFVKEGAEYLKTLFITYGIDAECSITIDELDLSEQIYLNIYNGIIDFSTYNEDSNFVEVSIIDKDIFSKFLAREEIPVNVLDTENLDGDTIINPVGSLLNIKLPPINPTYWANSNDAEMDLVISGTGLSSNYSTVVEPSGTIEVNYIGADFDETNLKYTNSSGAGKNTTFAVKLRTLISGNIHISNAGSPPSSINFNVKVRKYDGGTILQEYDYTTPVVGGDYPLSFDDSIDTEYLALIGSGDSQGFYTEITIDFGLTVDGYVEFDYNTSFDIYDISYEEISAVGQTDCKSLKPQDLGTRLMEQMGIDTSINSFYSDEFKSGGDFEFLQLTSGKNIRQFPVDTPINISFREFFNTYSRILGLIFEFKNNKFTFTKYADIYQNPIVNLVISNVSNVTYATATDIYFNSVNVGYGNYKYNEYNGNIEFNTNFDYATVNKNIKNKKDLKSEVRADSLGIEMLRRNIFKNNGSEDVDGENDLFLISSTYDTEKKFYRAQLGSDFTTIEGIRNANQYYNYLITPKSNLVRNKFLLSSSLHYQNKAVKYVKSKNNIPLVIDGMEELSGLYDSEFDLNITPIRIEFDTILNNPMWVFLNGNPNGKIKILTANYEFYGYIEEVTINIYKRTAHFIITKQWAAPPPP